MAHTSSSKFDAPVAAALGLGFQTRSYCSDALNDCLLTLFNEIHPNVYTSLNRLIARIETSYEYFNTTPREAYSSSPEEWKPNSFDTDALCRFADRAFADGSYLWPWYRVGAILGDCELAHPEGDVSLEQFKSVVDCLRNLPSEACKDIAVIKRLLKIGSVTAAIDAFERACDQVTEESEVHTCVPRTSMIARFASAVIAGVGQLPLSLQDSSQGARDRWLYEQVRDKVPHKRILAQLKSFRDWEPITSAQGIIAAVRRFARRKGMPPPQARRSGRPRHKE